MSTIRHYYQLSRKSALTLLFIIGLAFVSLQACQAQEVNDKMIPVFIYNFTKYIDWPSQVHNEFVIGVVGNTEHFEKMGKATTIKGRKIIIKKINLSSEITGCQMVYIPADQASKLKEYVELCKDKPVLLISNKAGLIRKGVDINLFIDEEDDLKTKFEINKSKIEKEGLKISKELLSLAYTVIDTK